jgi:hypothetical protein
LCRGNGFYCPIKPTPPPVIAVGPWESTDEAVDGAGVAEWHPVPAVVAKTFPALCKMWSIVNEVLDLYFGNRPNIADMRSQDTLRLVESTYQRLLDWSDGLSLIFSEAENSSSYVMNMQ